MAVVILDTAAWREMFPQHADPDLSGDALLESLWPLAESLIGGNTAGSRIPYDPPRTAVRETLLYFVLCHLVTLSLRGDVVGTVTSATQGSVSTALSLAQKTNSRWWDQTPCGMTAWHMLSKYRLGGLYITGGCRCGG